MAHAHHTPFGGENTVQTGVMRTECRQMHHSICNDVQASERMPMVTCDGMLMRGRIDRYEFAHSTDAVRPSVGDDFDDSITFSL